MLVTRVVVSLWGACAAGRLTAGMPIEQFVVSEVEAARSPSYGLGRKPEYDPRVLSGATGTSPFSHAPRNEADAGASPSGALSGFFEAPAGASGDEGITAVTTSSSGTVLFFFVMHCFFASTQGLFNDLLILRGFHAQFALLAVHNALCGLVGFAVVANVEREKNAKQLRFSQVARYCLPLAVCHSAKLYAQNKALEYVSPAFVSMVYGATPVLVAVSCVCVGWEPLRFRAGALVAVAAAGVVLTAVGEGIAADDADAARGAGAALAAVSVVAEVGRLLLLEHLLRRLRVTVGALLVYTAPLEIALLTAGAVAFESRWLMDEVPKFKRALWFLLAGNSAWAVGTNVTTYCFVRAGSALLAACAAPFKDVATIVLSDTFVEPRRESRVSVFGYSVACVASFAYCVGKLDEREARVEASRFSSKTSHEADDDSAPLLARNGAPGTAPSGAESRASAVVTRRGRARFWLVAAAAAAAICVNLFFALVDAPDKERDNAAPRTVVR